MANQAKNLVNEISNAALSIKVKSGSELKEFGGLLAVGYSSPKPGPRLIEVAYTPRGSVTAALFLEHFAGERNWVHLDIAGPARSESDSGENPKGGTGYGVRVLTNWLTTL